MITKEAKSPRQYREELKGNPVLRRNSKGSSREAKAQATDRTDDREIVGNKQMHARTETGEESHPPQCSRSLVGCGRRGETLTKGKEDREKKSELGRLGD